MENDSTGPEVLEAAGVQVRLGCHASFLAPWPWMGAVDVNLLPIFSEKIWF